MTTGNRTNEPNKYAGFLARQNHQRDPWRGTGVKCLCGKVFGLDADHAMHQVEAILEAALAEAEAHLPSVGQIAEVLERKLGHAHRDAPYADLTEEAVAVRALFGEVAGDEILA